MPTVTQTYTVRLRNRGQVSIPRDVRDKMMAEEGDILTLLQIDDLMLLTRRQPRVPVLTEQFTAEMENAGVSLADLLKGLSEEREAIYRERPKLDA